MIRKDFIEAEIQKLNQVLARIIGLKNDGKVDDATDLAFSTLNNDFQLSQESLESDPLSDFELWLRNQKFTGEKLNVLGALLFESVYPFLETAETRQILHKTALILNLLETEYHQQSFENLHRREQIDKFLSNLQYE